ncbi:hypothetical protein Pint_12364 [Pistacia integerrima]|uniref:Uncharacterized protein n=1 Tax=Pistacia integerrima TaxID=434235 RepID=A0ACC0Y8S3_9ROSI|nr:hypothetical protein Pint_12364 [Pistacia integerrima]
MVLVPPRLHSFHRPIRFPSDGSYCTQSDLLYTVALISRSFCLSERTFSHFLFSLSKRKCKNKQPVLLQPVLCRQAVRDLLVLLFNSKSKKVWKVMKRSEESRRSAENRPERQHPVEIAGSVAGPGVQPSGESQRKRGRSPADKENKRLKRLLRNRVSAQQARERKKAYLSELETRVKDLEKKNSELEERLSTLQNENQMLRHILKNTTASRRGGSDTNAE